MPLSHDPQLDPSDIKLLRLFRKIVDCGGFAGAQAELNVSASTISSQMSTLESRLGMRLCDRGRVGFRVTDKGWRVYASALQLEEAIDRFRLGIGELRGKLVGDLHLATVDSTVTNPQYRLDRALARFAARDHAVHITLHIAQPAVIEQKLIEGAWGIGIAPFYHHVPGLAYEHLFEEEQGLYCSREHPLFGRDQVTASEVANASYVMRGYMRREMPPVADMKVAATTFDMEATVTLIRSGFYIGHLPLHYARHWVETGELRLLLPDTFSFFSRFELAVRKGVSELRVIRAFLEDLGHAHGEGSPGRPGRGEARSNAKGRAETG